MAAGSQSLTFYVRLDMKETLASESVRAAKGANAGLLWAVVLVCLTPFMGGAIFFAPWSTSTSFAVCGSFVVVCLLLTGYTLSVLKRAPRSWKAGAAVVPSVVLLVVWLFLLWMLIDITISHH